MIVTSFFRRHDRWKKLNPVFSIGALVVLVRVALWDENDMIPFHPNRFRYLNQNDGRQHKEKSTVSSSIELSSKPIHNIELLLDHTPVRDQPPEEQKLIQDLRYVTFGDSHTYGSGVDVEPGYSIKDAFPYLLSPKVNNLAIPAHDLSYPTMCLSSMVGEAYYDVAVILGIGFRPWDPNDKSARLAKRLRDRFPDIIIIIIFHKFAGGIVWKEKGKGDLPLMTWAKQHLPGVDKSHPMFLEKMKEFAKEHKDVGKWGDWFFWGVDDIRGENKNLRSKVPSLGTKIHENLGNNTFMINFFSAINSPFEYMEKFASYACETDYHHPCHVAHRNYADAIQQLVQAVMKTRLNNETNNAVRHDVVEPWVQQDRCRSWFNPGKAYTMVGIDNNTRGFQYNCFTNAKCSLEMVENEGFITVTNEAKIDQYLAITFMATGLDHPKISYPKTKVETIHKNKNGTSIVLSSMIADPIATVHGRVWTHTGKVIQVGKIPPGDTVIHFTALESNKLNRFRLVSYMMTEENFRGKGYHNRRVNKLSSKNLNLEELEGFMKESLEDY